MQSNTNGLSISITLFFCPLLIVTITMDATMYLIIHRSNTGKRQVITRERGWFMAKQAKDYYQGFHGCGNVFIDFIK